MVVETRTWSFQLGGGGGAVPWTTAALALLVLAVAAAPAVAAAQRTVLRRDRAPYKPYTGLRADELSDRQIYFHEQTIAVVELGPKRELLNCELIEVVTPEISKAALQNLSAINKPIRISFNDMKMLMYQCKDFQAPEGSTSRGFDESTKKQVNPWSVLTGILPGTKWCGNGDLASNYYDLGYLAEVDKCCRAHDICPIKVRGFQNRYDLMNLSFYTKSHCDCDTIFYQCLKATQHPTANLMGTFYFNLLRVQCIAEGQQMEKTDINTESKPMRHFRNPLHVY